MCPDSCETIPHIFSLIHFPVLKIGGMYGMPMDRYSLGLPAGPGPMVNFSGLLVFAHAY
jgi:hypothetical protein